MMYYVYIYSAAIHGVAKSWTWLSDWFDLIWSDIYKTMVSQPPCNLDLRLRWKWQKKHSVTAVWAHISTVGQYNIYYIYNIYIIHNWNKSFVILNAIYNHFSFFLFFKLWKYDNTFIGDLENTEHSYIQFYHILQLFFK